ncbi:MAG: cytochrome c oxidase subunit II [Thaumarchaeota archaeon]|nr:cytochrome c oxidase subunit II [Nitrososphaerota archaeon]
MVSNTSEIFIGLFNQFWFLGVLVSIVVLGLMTYLMLRFRDQGAKTPDPEDAPMLGKIPEDRGKIKTVAISLTLSSLILALLLGGTFGAIDAINNPPQGTLNVEVTGFQWGWKFKYPNNYQDTVMTVPKDEVVIVKIHSDDVFHSFGILEFKIKKDALNGRVNTIWFVARDAGEYNIVCYEFCGLGHTFMRTKLIVMEPNEFQDWYSKLKPGEIQHAPVQQGGQQP